MLTELCQIGRIVFLHETEKMGETFGGRGIALETKEGGDAEGCGRGIDPM
jgi:hypothetical protein